MQPIKPNETKIGFASLKGETIWFNADEEFSAEPETISVVAIDSPEAGKITVPLNLLPRSIFTQPSLMHMQLDKLIEHINTTYRNKTPFKIPPQDVRAMVAKLPDNFIQQAERELFGVEFDNVKPEFVDINSQNEQTIHPTHPIRIARAITVKENQYEMGVDPIAHTAYGCVIQQYDESAAPSFQPKGTLPLHWVEQVDYLETKGDADISAIDEYYKLADDQQGFLKWSVESSPMLKKIFERAEQDFDNSPPIFCNNKPVTLAAIEKTLKLVNQDPSVKQTTPPPSIAPKI